MQEAFNKFRQQNPDSPIVRQLNNEKQYQVAKRIRLEKERQFAQLRRQFENVGLMWYGTKINKSTDWFLEHNRIRITIEQKKEQWIQALTTLKNTPSEQRIALLTSLASGMQLSENNTNPSDDVKYRSFFRFIPLGYSGNNPSNVSFTRPSRHFIEAIGDMLGHSGEQQEKFREFMIREAGLTGKVGLPQLFPGISRWLDHTK